MNMNVAGMIVGFSLFVTCLYRQFPIPGELFGKFLWQWVPLAILCVALGVFLYCKGGSTLFSGGMVAVGKCAAQYLPVLFWFLFAMGFGTVLAILFGKEIKAALEGDGGIVYCFGAAWLSSSAQMLVGFVKELWMNEALRPRLLYCLTVTPLVSWNIFLLRQMGLGWNISLPMYAINIGIAILLMIPFWIWSRLIGG